MSMFLENLLAETASEPSIHVPDLVETMLRQLSSISRRRAFSKRVGDNGRAFGDCRSRPPFPNPPKYNNRGCERQQQGLFHNSIVHRKIQIREGAFQRLRACYFSNATELTFQDGDETSLDTSEISNDLLQLYVNNENDPSFSFVRNMKLWYLENHGETGKVVQDAFDTQMIQNPEKVLLGATKPDSDNAADQSDFIRQIFTATFTCPVTKEIFRAGKLPGGFEIDQKNYYSKKKTALQAVSAVVLSRKIPTTTPRKEDLNKLDGLNDQNSPRQRLQRLYMQKLRTSPTKSQTRTTMQCFVGKENGGTWWTSEFVCPIHKQTYKAANLPDVPTSMKMEQGGRVWYRKKSDAVHAAALMTIDSIDWESENASADLETHYDAPDELSDVMEQLAVWYQQHEDCAPSLDENFVVTETAGDAGLALWTASFLCPQTGDRFDSGTVNATNMVRHSEIDGLNWYADRNASIVAAGLRAHDAFKYRETGIADPRFCREDPSQILPDQEMAQEYGTDRKDADIFDDLHQIRDGDDPSDEDDDDFVIEVIPQQLSQGGASATLDVIAQAWVGSMVSIGGGNDTQDQERSIKDAFRERQRTIDRASEWLSQKRNESTKAPSDRTQFDIEGQTFNLTIANTILSSLAETHQCIPFNPQPSGTEECATAILDGMWASQSTTPDATSYASYLKCLEGESPTVIAQRALEILDAMETGQEYNGRILPKPDDSVYSTIAQIQDFSGMDDVREISGNNSLDRTVHLSRLSRMAYNPSTFDIDLATKHIDEMETLYQSSGNPLMQPDIEAYNAPLRWSGGSLWSRWYSRVIPWDSYGEIFRNGFKDESEVEIDRQQAERVEQWIEIINRKALSNDKLIPNIQTYESLIQSWVRCGSRETLSHSETIATKLMNGDYVGIRPRPQTLYPILAAWVYSGCDEGPPNVESWIQKAQELDPDTDELSAFASLSSMAQVSLQQRKMEILTSTSERMAFALECAKKCSQLLANTIHQRKGCEGMLIRGDIFKLTIHAWYNAALASISNENVEETRFCNREIQNVVKAFDELLILLYQSHQDDEKASSVLSHLLEQAPSVYGAQHAVMKEIQETISKSHNGEWNSNGSAYQLVSIEETIRKVEEAQTFKTSHEKIVNDHQSLNIENKDILMSAFPSEILILKSACRNWADTIEQSLESVDNGELKLATNEPDLIRICKLATRLCLSASPEVLPPESRDRITDKVIDVLQKYMNQNKDSEVAISALIGAMKKHTGAANKRESIPGASAGDIHTKSNEKVTHGSDKSQNAQTQRKIRRKRSRGNDLNLHRSSHSRLRVPSRSVRRRSRPRQAKANVV